MNLGESEGHSMPNEHVLSVFLRVNAGHSRLTLASTSPDLAQPYAHHNVSINPLTPYAKPKTHLAVSFPNFGMMTLPFAFLTGGNAVPPTWGSTPPSPKS